MKRHRFLLPVLLLSLGMFSLGCAYLETKEATPKKAHDSSVWEDAMNAFEQKDKESPPPKDGVVFIGSSSVGAWKTKKDFPGFNVLNRGFGGSHIEDSIRYAPRILFPCKPRLIVFYAGDNDLNSGKSPKKVFADFRHFAEMVHKQLPNTKLVYIGIKPCPSRWAIIKEVRKTNRMIEDYIRKHSKKDPWIFFVDIENDMLGKDGKPRPELYAKDQLHLSEAGYKIWNDKIRPFLETYGRN